MLLRLGGPAEIYCTGGALCAGVNRWVSGRPATAAADIILAQTFVDRHDHKHMAEAEDNEIDADQRRHDQLEGHSGLPASPSRAAGSEFARGTSASACAASRACSAFWAIRSR
jgi:hypothetical protein